jgi:hypothetical protein
MNPAHWDNLENMDTASKEYLEKSLAYVQVHQGEKN